MVTSRTYQTSELAKDFAVNPMTVRTWAGDYADHLSDDANPPKGTTRAFTVDDAQILALVAQLRKHKNSEEIHARLRNGERGTFPLITNATLGLPETQQEIRQLELQLEDKDQQMAALNNQIIELNAELIEARNAPHTQIKILQAQLSDRDKQLAELKADMAQMRKELLDVFTKGVDYGMSRANPAPGQGDA
jgi:DNA-binding transcriptional MerR regulator